MLCTTGTLVSIIQAAKLKRKSAGTKFEMILTEATCHRPSKGKCRSRRTPQATDAANESFPCLCQTQNRVPRSSARRPVQRSGGQAHAMPTGGGADRSKHLATDRRARQKTLRTDHTQARCRASGFFFGCFFPPNIFCARSSERGSSVPPEMFRRNGDRLRSRPAAEIFRAHRFDAGQGRFAVDGDASTPCSGPRQRRAARPHPPALGEGNETLSGGRNVPQRSGIEMDGSFVRFCEA